jgi:hypothetical protein
LRRLIFLGHRSVAVAAGTVPAASTAIHESVVPGAILVLEFCALLAALAKPERLILADFDSIKPRIAGLFISKCKDNINFF